MVGSDPSSSRFLLAGADCRGDAVVIENVTNNFVERIRLDRFLDEVARTLLQSGKNIVLIADGRDHDDPGVGMFLDDTLDGFDPFHLRHRYVHQKDIRLGASVFGDGRAAIARFADYLSAEGFDHFREALSREDGIVHDQVAYGLAVFLSG